MEHAVVLLMLTLMVISAAACLAPRLGIPAQLILVVAGTGISLIPSRDCLVGTSKAARAVAAPR